MTAIDSMEKVCPLVMTALVLSRRRRGGSVAAAQPPDRSDADRLDLHPCRPPCTHPPPGGATARRLRLSIPAAAALQSPLRALQSIGVPNVSSRERRTAGCKKVPAQRLSVSFDHFCRCRGCWMTGDGGGRDPSGPGLLPFGSVGTDGESVHP